MREAGRAGAMPAPGVGNFFLPEQGIPCSDLLISWNRSTGARRRRCQADRSAAYRGTLLGFDFQRDPALLPSSKEMRPGSSIGSRVAKFDRGVLYVLFS